MMVNNYFRAKIIEFYQPKLYLCYTIRKKGTTKYIKMADGKQLYTTLRIYGISTKEESKSSLVPLRTIT